MDITNVENNIINALQQLYNNPDTKLRHEADVWLKDFQVHEKIAWVVADNLLRKENSAYETQYYASQTLYIKIKTQGHNDLTTESRTSLRDSLFAHIVRYRAARTSVVTKLSLCIAALALQMGAEWPNVIPSILGSTLAQPEYSRCLLCLLTVFPEECYTSSMHVSRDQEQQLGDQLTQATPSVIQVLLALMQTARDTDTQAQIFACMASWLRLGGLKYENIVGNPLVSAPFDAMTEPKLFEPALDAACELVALSRAPEFAPMRQFIVARVTALRPLFQKAVAEEDEEVARGLTRLYSEVCEEYIVAILEIASQAEFSLLAILLECTAYPDIEITAITFPFWRVLSEALVSQNRQKYNLQAFLPAYEVLLGCIVKCACYPSDSDSWPEDTLENFRHTRKVEIAAVLRGVCDVMDARQCLSRIDNTFKQQLAAYTNGGDWRQVEGCLYCIRAIARCLTAVPQDTPVLTILHLLPKLPSHKEIQYTALLIVGRYADWLNTDTTLLPLLFSFVIQSLQREESAPSAALAFNHVCSACQKTIATSYLQEILNVYAGIQSLTSLRLDDHLEILKGLSYVISTLSLDKLVHSLQLICQPLVITLQQVTTTTHTEAPPKLLANTLCKLAAVFQKPDIFIDDNNPSNNMKIAEALWPTLDRVFTMHNRNVEVVEQLCRCVRYLLECFPQEFTTSSVLLGPLVQQIINGYVAGHHACLIRVAASLIRTHGKNSDYDGVLWSLVENVSHATFGFTSTLESMTTHPDIVWEYALLMERVCMHNRLQLWMCKPGLADSIIQWGALSLPLHHREAIKSVCQLLVSLIKVPSKPDATIAPVLERSGATLSQQLLASVAGVGTYSKVLRVCEVLVALRAWNQQHFQAWMTATVQIFPIPDQDKSRFISKIMSTDDTGFAGVVEDLFSILRKHQKNSK